MTASITFLLGLCIGYVIKQLIGQKATVKENEQLGEKFKAFASDILKETSDSFTRNAKKDFDSAKDIVKTTLEERERGFEKIAQNVNEIVTNLEKKVSEMETERLKQLTSLDEGIKRVLDIEGKIGDSVNNLKTALSSGNAIRGKWGETFLKNVLDDCGMQEGTDYTTQHNMQTEEGNLRPDIVVNLPGETKIVVDSKANLSEYFAALEEKDDSKKREHVANFIKHVKGEIQRLSSKEYQKHLDTKVPYVIMFIPSESAIRVAFQSDSSLFIEAQQKKVILASPTTIMPMLLLIAHAWKQHKTSEDAYKVTAEIADLGKRLQTFFGHIIDMNSGLEKVNEKFNSAVGSWDKNVAPKLTSFKKIGLDIESKGTLKTIDSRLKIPEKLEKVIKEE